MSCIKCYKYYNWNKKGKLRNKLCCPKYQCVIFVGNLAVLYIILIGRITCLLLCRQDIFSYSGHFLHNVLVSICVSHVHSEENSYLLQADCTEEEVTVSRTGRFLTSFSVPGFLASGFSHHRWKSLWVPGAHTLQVGSVQSDYIQSCRRLWDL